MGSTDLESQALQQFDRLLAKGELLWNETQPRHITSEPFDFEFRIATSLQKKPIDTKQKTPTKNAFPASEGDWTLGPIGKDHKLILNKFCVVRPQFVLPTNEYQPQSDALNAGDFDAGWEVLTRLRANGGDGDDEKYMVIFNCGVESGSSVGHKHLQCIPQPLGAKHGRKNFFSLLRSDGEGEIEKVAGAPFEHGALRLDRDDRRIDGKSLDELYVKLRESLNLRIEDGKVPPHNVLLTRTHLVVIPRTKAWVNVEGKDTVIAGNAAGMIGLVYTWSEEQYEAWQKYGPMKALGELGVVKA
ncbi:Protein APA1 [Cercospora beticola]|uniref:Protein APA1 n=1 Tax=Cercospora beticola TaxID=122368 RepID=A0A2G5HMS4_CERBT|nr:Protein APA1 [Cercospora beticola]PIA93851.1 Protein APA1 [Cercospora beticola]WPB02091.1 hypothetical protein RHO25_006725 [Cercospora beticola]